MFNSDEENFFESPLRSSQNAEELFTDKNLSAVFSGTDDKENAIEEWENSLEGEENFKISRTRNDIDSDLMLESPLKSSPNEDEFSNDKNNLSVFSGTDEEDDKENAADVEDWDTCLEDGGGKFLTNQIHMLPSKKSTSSLDSTEAVAATIAENLSRILVICPNRSVAEQALGIVGASNLNELSEKVQAKLEEFFKQNTERKIRRRKAKEKQRVRSSSFSPSKTPTSSIPIFTAGNSGQKRKLSGDGKRLSSDLNKHIAFTDEDEEINASSSSSQFTKVYKRKHKNEENDWDSGV